MTLLNCFTAESSNGRNVCLSSEVRNDASREGLVAFTTESHDAAHVVVCLDSQHTAGYLNCLPPEGIVRGHGVYPNNRAAAARERSSAARLSAPPLPFFDLEEALSPFMPRNCGPVPALAFSRRSSVASKRCSSPSS